MDMRVDMRVDMHVDVYGRVYKQVCESLCGCVGHGQFVQVPGYKVEKKAEGEEAVGIVLKHFGLDPSQSGLRVTFGGDLTAVSGTD